MNREELKRNYLLFLERENLTPDQVLVGAGGAMVMHGLRKETEDIDVEVSPKNFERFTGLPSHRFGETLVLECQDLLVDIHSSSDMSGVLVDGVYVYGIERLLAFKMSLNRVKDQKDIATLRSVLSQSA